MTLRVAFSDLSPILLRDVRMLRDALGPVEFTDAGQADLLVYGDYGNAHRSFAGTKVYFTAENYRPRWDETDFAVGFDRTADARYLRAPLYVLHAYRDQVEGFAPEPGPDWDQRAFCNFVYFRPGTRMRRALFKELSKYRPVTSPGRFLNNASAPELSDRNDVDWRRSKIAYQRGFRFTIAAENGSSPGYVTEKLYDAILAGTIPVYWGDAQARLDIDEDAFVNCADYARIDDVVALVRKIDSDPELARPYLESRPFLRTTLEDWLGGAESFFASVRDHAMSHRDDPAHSTRAEWLRREPSRSRAAGLARTATALDKRLGGVLRRVYNRVPGARRIATALRGTGFRSHDD